MAALRPTLPPAVLFRELGDDNRMRVLLAALLFDVEHEPVTVLAIARHTSLRADRVDAVLQRLEQHRLVMRDPQRPDEWRLTLVACQLLSWATRGRAANDPGTPIAVAELPTILDRGPALDASRAALSPASTGGPQA